ncbi:hypothetical protein DOTSEDRAFT_29886 [Dothistroma septosporum NZE10]|uniref:Uncharacterized protein n=1 Tax=Dothistroma septosporum (strain NZE10 / CBS 128990) TaxID=675120 RepID=N1Q1S1_DOTSN|nr:hypothetical protein DOTSEDRAFT_29886 [Dothistroma septosporum NZE10]
MILAKSASRDDARSVKRSECRLLGVAHLQGVQPTLTTPKNVSLGRMGSSPAMNLLFTWLHNIHENNRQERSPCAKQADSQNFLKLLGLSYHKHRCTTAQLLTLDYNQVDLRTADNLATLATNDSDVLHFPHCTFWHGLQQHHECQSSRQHQDYRHTLREEASLPYHKDHYQGEVKEGCREVREEDELLDSKVRSSTEDAQLEAEVTARGCAKRKNLEAEHKAEALAREMQTAREEVFAAEAARVHAEQEKTRFEEQPLALKREYHEVLVEIERSREQMNVQLAEMEKQREALEIESEGSQFQTLDFTRQQLAKLEKGRAAEEEAESRAIAQRNAAAYANEETQQNLIALEKECNKKLEGMKTLYKRKKKDSEKSLATSAEKLAKLTNRFDEIEDEKLDLEEENSELKSNLEIDPSTTQGNVARATRSAYDENMRAAGPQLALDQERAKSASLEDQYKQSVSTLKEILPEEMKFAVSASLEELAETVIAHHQFLLEKVEFAQTKIEDIQADFQARNTIAQKPVKHADQQLYKASGSIQQDSSLQSQLDIARQHATKLPQFQADHDKHFNVAENLKSQLNANEI